MDTPGSELSLRQREILLATVREHIETSGPVPSRLIQEKYFQHVSPATVRNELAELERQGYLEKPHTSAGRVPREKGYRFYVDRLEAARPDLSRDYTYIRKRLGQSPPTPTDLLRTAVTLLSELTGQPALASEPAPVLLSYPEFALSPISARTLRISYETPEGRSRELLWEAPVPLRSEQIQMLQESLREELQDLAGEEVEARETAASAEIPLEVVTNLLQALFRSGENRIHVEGTTRLLDQPDFAPLPRVLEVISSLAREEVARSLLRRPLFSPDLLVLIGSEHHRTTFADCSLVVQSYSGATPQRGAVGVLGPMRMAYGHAISLVHCVSREITSLLGENAPETES